MSENETKVQEFPTKQSVQIDVTDNTYRLAEMADAMRQSMQNAINVSKEQNVLIEIVLASSKAKDFEDFVKNIEAQIDDINKQVVTLDVRAGLLDKVVDACKANEETARIVSMLLKALGVFENN